MPLTTRVPRNGGRGIALVVSTSGDRCGIGPLRALARLRSGSTRPLGTRPNSGSSRPDRFISIKASSVDRPSKASRP